MGALSIGFFVVLLAVILGWDLVAFVALPILISASAYLVSFVFGRFEPSSSKYRNVAVVAAATCFLILSAKILFPN